MLLVLERHFVYFIEDTDFDGPTWDHAVPVKICTPYTDDKNLVSHTAM